MGFGPDGVDATKGRPLADRNCVRVMPDSGIIRDQVRRKLRLDWRARTTPVGCGPNARGMQPNDDQGPRMVVVIDPYRGRKVGKAITSRIEGLSVSSITSRSMPTPSPPQGGSPYSRAPM